MIAVSVILCTRNPDRHRLARTLAGLAAQTLPLSEWELRVIDNSAIPSLSATTLPPHPANLRIVTEARPGLTPARLCGIARSQGDVLVFVDDDNVLSATYLAAALAAFRASPSLAAAGGPIRPDFEQTPPSWAQEFYCLLALHNHGPHPKIARGGPVAPWPAFAPPGAGLCLRRSAACAYAAALASDPQRNRLDRRAGELTSGGDNDMVFTALHCGGDVAYLPKLALTHLIPPARLAPDYLARLNQGIQRSWVRVLALHGQCPWPAIPRFSLPPRVARAWLRTRAWRGPAEQVRFHGLYGRLRGQADLG